MSIKLPSKSTSKSTSIKPSPIMLVVSMDGIAPRHINPDTMPALISIARQGAACYQAKTILPCWTLPVHASMLCGVSPSEHGIIDNTPKATNADCVSLLKQAREHGLSTAAFFNWERFNGLLESDAVEQKFTIDGGYCVTEDERMNKATIAAIRDRKHQVIFTYLARGDLAGHEHGWDSQQYIDEIRKADLCLAKMIAALEDHDSILVTTDHGGLGHHHEEGRPEDLRTFVVVKSPKLPPASHWSESSILDVAPTVAAIMDFPPASQWSGNNLIGREQPLLDCLVSLLEESGQHYYGEHVTMLDHALQTAALAAQQECDDSMILACLLHDIGHLLGDAGQWGLPGHAEIGAHALQPFVNPCVYEPIRYHVEAKRYLIATDPNYKNSLSTASIESLHEQGGMLSTEQSDAFVKHPFAEQAIMLRRFDDSGKVSGLDIPPLETYRGLIERALIAPITDPRWARDACHCPECRDPNNGQHLIHAEDLNGWLIVGENYHNQSRKNAQISAPNGIHARPNFRLRHDNGETHLCYTSAPHAVNDRTVQIWGAEHATSLLTQSTQASSDTTKSVQQLIENGISLVRGVATESGAVIKFANNIGYVRETNYGVLFDVLAEPDPINLAYTPIGLPLHTDNPYRHPSPGVQLLHCLQNASTGGSSQFADGFRAATLLREKHPDAFDCLCQQIITFHFQDKDVLLENRKPIIELDQDGEVKAVYVNNRSMQAPSQDMIANQRFYTAYELFTQLLASPESVIEITLQAGDLIMFDNSRVLHGRKAYAISERRHLQGCYIDIDAPRSTYQKHAVH